MVGHPRGQPTKITPLYWFAKARFVVLQQTFSDGTRVFPLFTNEDAAYTYQSGWGFGPEWTLWTANYAEYILNVLDTTKEGFDIYMVDPPPEMGAFHPYYTLEALNAKIMGMGTAEPPPQN